MRRILITGASGGIGSAIALRLAKANTHIILQGRNRQALQHIYQQVTDAGATADIWVCDFAELDDAKLDAYSYLLSNIDCYIHCSGHSLYKMLMDTDLVEWDLLFQIHIRSAFLLSKRVLPSMGANRFGRIVLISSIWGEVGASCEVAYSAAKGAVQSFTKALAKEVAPSGITVNAIAPGAIETRMIYDQFSVEEVTELQEQIPIGRLGRPEEIATLVEFLASEHSSYITGQIISINGGWK